MRARESIAVSPAHSAFGFAPVGNTIPVQSSSQGLRGAGFKPNRTSQRSHACPVTEASE